MKKSNVERSIGELNEEVMGIEELARKNLVSKKYLEILLKKHQLNCLGVVNRLVKGNPKEESMGYQLAQLISENKLMDRGWQRFYKKIRNLYSYPGLEELK